MIRFCRSLGCKGLSDFKLRLASGLTGTMPITHTQVTGDDTILEVGDKVLGNTASAILQVRDHLNRDSIDQAVRLISDAERVEFYAVGHFGSVADDAQFKLLRMGVSAAAYTVPRLQVLAANLLHPGVVAVVISGSGRIEELLEVVDKAHERGAVVIAITASQSPLARKADVALIVDHVEDIATQVPMISRILHLLMIDILVVGVSMRRGEASLPQLGDAATIALDEGAAGARRAGTPAPPARASARPGRWPHLTSHSRSGTEGGFPASPGRNNGRFTCSAENGYIPRQIAWPRGFRLLERDDQGCRSRWPRFRSPRCRAPSMATTTSPQPVRQAVLKVAAELRYSPHAAARSLSSKRTHTIGVVLPDLHGEFFSELVRGIDQVAREHGQYLLVSSYHGHPEEQGAALRAMRGRVDGLLVMSPYADDSGYLTENLSPSLPVGADQHAPARRRATPRCGIDNHGGAVRMVRHLVETRPPAHRLHRRAGSTTSTRANACAAIATRWPRLLPRREGVGAAGRFQRSLRPRGRRRDRGVAERPDAVFAANDMMALGCLFAFNQAGLRVPEDIALVGFDDIPLARYVHPPLTTMRVNIAELGGRRCAPARCRQSVADAPANRFVPEADRARIQRRQPRPRSDSS